MSGVRYTVAYGALRVADWVVARYTRARAAYQQHRRHQ